jgi:hypothetical protein
MQTEPRTRARDRSAIRIAAMVVVLAALVLGCGDDRGDNESTTFKPETTGGVTKAKFIKQGDAACSRHNEQIQRKAQALLRDAGESSQAELAAEIVNRVMAPRMEHEIRTVRAYVLPPEDVDQALRVLQAMQGVVDRAQKDPFAFVRTTRPFAKPEQLGEDFGFKVCGGL